MRATPLAWHPHVSDKSAETLLLGSVPEALGTYAMVSLALAEPLLLLLLSFLNEAMTLLLVVLPCENLSCGRFAFDSGDKELGCP